MPRPGRADFPAGSSGGGQLMKPTRCRRCGAKVTNPDRPFCDDCARQIRRRRANQSRARMLARGQDRDRG